MRWRYVGISILTFNTHQNLVYRAFWFALERVGTMLVHILTILMDMVGKSWTLVPANPTSNLSFIIRWLRNQPAFPKVMDYFWKLGITNAIPLNSTQKWNKYFWKNGTNAVSLNSTKKMKSNASQGSRAQSLTHSHCYYTSYAPIFMYMCLDEYACQDHIIIPIHATAMWLGEPAEDRAMTVTLVINLQLS